MDILKPLLKLLSKPREGGTAFAIKQMARSAPVVIGGTETRNWNAKLGSVIQEFSPVVFELLVCGAVPDFYGSCYLKQVIYMLMRSGG